jgi:hypothetical protein
MEVSVPSQENSVFGMSVFPLSTIFRWIMELFRQCDIICYSSYANSYWIVPSSDIQDMYIIMMY